MATKKTTKPKASAYTKQLATRMDVVTFARLLASSLGNDRWFTEDIIKNTFNQSGSAGTVKKDDPKATKIPNLESDSKVMDSLLSIQNLLKKNYEDKLRSDEKKNQFRVEQSVERKKQNDDFIKALNNAGRGTTNIVNNTTATKVDDDTGVDTVLDVFGLKSLGQTALKGLGMLGAFAVGPVGLALLTAAAAGSLGYFLYKVFTDKSGYEDPDSELSKGLKQAESVGGLAGVKDEEDRIRKLPEYEKTKTEIANYEKNYNEGEQLNDAQLKGYSQRGPEAARAVQDYKKQRDKRLTTIPTATPETPEMPVNSEPVASAEPAAMPAEPVASAEPAAMPEQISSPNVAQKLDVVNSENLEMKLPQEPSDKGMIVTNNEKTQSKKGSTKVALPSVRNAEETFQRMILNSTRVV
jgi:hypothetical protein